MQSPCPCCHSSELISVVCVVQHPTQPLSSSLPRCHDWRSGIYGSRSDRVLSSLWQTLLINLVINGANPRIDHW